ncbi:hypothetical protein [Marinimicrobium sp. C2-29]|uniref:hypothetical protein n=1 Tax=Marinimicrobium sp. C2-29 TaxID=3139825 RepID=UPI003138DDFB
MPDIRFSQTPANANQLCQQDPETLQQFLRCNPQVANGNTTMPEHFAYNISPESALGSRIVTQQFNSLPMTARQNLNQCVADYGEDVHALAEFYERHLANFELPSPADVNGVAGVGVAAAQGRTTSFQNALVQYQAALIELHRHNKVGRVAGAQKIQLRQKVTEAYDRLNRHYAQEMRRIIPPQHRNRNRGTALSNAERGITLAERSRGRGIHVADMHEGQKVSRFAQALRYTGRGIVALDVGFRGQRVRSEYQSVGEWERELAVQTGGFAGAGFGGGLGARAALTVGRLALAATPMGWALVIGSSIAVGAVVAYQSDKQVQTLVGSVWDYFLGE